MKRRANPPAREPVATTQVPHPAETGAGRLLTVPASPPGPRPFVLVNMAVTADGKIATANRRIAAFGSVADTENLYRLRATVDAIVCGAGTIEAENAILDPGATRFRRARRRRGLTEWPLRIAVSGSASLSPEAALFRNREAPVLVWSTARAAKSRLERLGNVAREVWVCGDRSVDLRRACIHLTQAWGVQRLLCEGGGALNDAFFRAGLVDEVHLTLCPFLVGGREAPTIADGEGVARLAEGRRFRLRTRRRKGDELFLVYTACSE